jgi:hypothetical protein
VHTAHHGFESGDEAAGRGAPGLGAIRTHHPIHGQAVGDDDEICCSHEGSSRGFLQVIEELGFPRIGRQG